MKLGYCIQSKSDTNEYVGMLSSTKSELASDNADWDHFVHVRFILHKCVQIVIRENN